VLIVELDCLQAGHTQTVN